MCRFCWLSVAARDDRRQALMYRNHSEAWHTDASRTRGVDSRWGGNWNVGRFIDNAARDAKVGSRDRYGPSPYPHSLLRALLSLVSGTKAGGQHESALLNCHHAIHVQNPSVTEGSLFIPAG
jgi:hypothetical protein